MKFEAPTIDIIEFDIVDIIQTSDIGGGGGPNETPINPVSTLDDLYN